MTDLRLGAIIDPATHARTPTPALLPAADLTTHGVIVGMTGSGKTGLATVLVEECLSAGVPALLIDPKGDLGNLALTFPGLMAEEFLPWVSQSDTERAGVPREAFAVDEARRWREGLAGWGLGTQQVGDLHDAADVTIYTPGSPHGVQLNLMGTLDVPGDLSDPQAVADEIESYVSSLLNLIGVESDPLSSREHILLASIINAAWSEGRALTLETLLASVIQPPFRKIGVLDVDAYYPPADRSKLAMRLNGLLASPAFAPWLGGDRIDIAAMLRTPEGRPRCAIVSTAHLSDEQRQSATSVVLAKLVAWMRRQSGTTDLRALLYMDEVAGYLPPVGNPPTKGPIMLLLKQARAFGVGVVLATQNPVDVDYKALSNAGTWLVGRLQTEQDKARLMDGLFSASGAGDARAIGAAISALGKREFVMRRAASDVPQVFTTRWAMSYLRGPLNRAEVTALRDASRAGAGIAVGPGPAGAGTSRSAATSVGVGAGAMTRSDPAQSLGGEVPSPAVDASGPVRSAPAISGPATLGLATSGQGLPTSPGPSSGTGPPATPEQGASPASRAGRALADDESVVLPTIAAGIPVRYLDPAASWGASVGAVPGNRLVACVVARIALRYDDTKAGLDLSQEYEAVLFPVTEDASPEQFVAVDYDDRDLLVDPPAASVYRLVPSALATKAWWTRLQSGLVDHLYRTMSVSVPANPDLKLYGRVGELHEEFAARCMAAAQDRADAEIARIAGRYDRRIADVQRRLDTAEQAAERVSAQRNATLATDLLGGLFGGRRRSWATTARQASAAHSRVGAAEDRVDLLARQLTDLREQAEGEAAEVRRAWADRSATITTLDVGLERSDVAVRHVGLVWVPQGTHR